MTSDETAAAAQLMQERDMWKQRAEGLMKQMLAIQAKVDALMLEYSPDEMTAENSNEWAKNQVVSENDCPSCDGTQMTINSAGEPDDCSDPCHRYGYLESDNEV